MQHVTPYDEWMERFMALLAEGQQLPLGGSPPCPRPDLPPDVDRVLLFSPHPDDESLVGMLALRLLREKEMRIVNVAVTQGSNEARKQPRLRELRGACEFLGFDLLQTAPEGFDDIKPSCTETDAWSRSVSIIAGMILDNDPVAVIFPHEEDWNGTHVGTNLLLMEALEEVEYPGLVIQSEFWHQMYASNLLIEVSPKIVGDLMASTSFHVGEVGRNPYHIGLPCQIADNPRRAEIVVGQGGKVPDFKLAAFYHIGRMENGEIVPAYDGGKVIACDGDIGEIFS